MILLLPLLAIPFIPAAASSATLTVDGFAVPKGRLTVAGTDYDRRVWIQLLWDGSPVSMPSVRTTNDGHLSTEMTIPSNSKVGSHTLSVVAGKPGGTKKVPNPGLQVLASVTVDVQEPPAPDPTPPPTPAPTAAPTATPDPTPPPTPKPTATPVPTATATPVPTATATPAPTATASPAPTATATPVPTATATPAPTATATPAPTATATPAATPTPPPPGITGAYGTIAADTKANLLVGPDGMLSHRFRASTTSTLTSVRFSQRGGPVYSGGTGGRMLITVRPDDGSGRPSSTILASISYVPGNPINSGWTTFLDLAFPTPTTVTAGNLYHIVFENLDPTPLTNYISVNELALLGSISSPRQPTFSDADLAVLTNRGTSWLLESAYTAVMDVSYGNGANDGQGYIEAMVAMVGMISGPSDMVRERFIVSGGDRIVTSVSVRVKRTAGSSPLRVLLETGAGVLIDQVSISASSVPLTALGGSNLGAVWVTGTFASPHGLSKGATYNVKLMTSADSAYATVPLREGTDSGNAGGTGNATGFRSDRFTDGSGQRTTDGGATWPNLYLYSPVDLQFYLK